MKKANFVPMKLPFPASFLYFKSFNIKCLKEKLN